MGINTSNRSTVQGSADRLAKRGRLRLLGSGSALAGAVALASIMSSPVAAQSIPGNIPQIPGSGVLIPTDASTRVDGPIMRGPANDRQPIAAARSQSFPTPIASNYYVENRGLTLNPPTVPDARVNNSQPIIAPPPGAVVVPPSTQAPATQTNAPVFAAGPVTTFASTPAPSPGDTDTNGINVLASANYFSSEIDFSVGAAVDVVDVLASEAIINWTTFTAGSAGSDVTFLRAGGSLEFTSALSDYTVLNRVFTPGIDSAVRIDGSITSTVLGGAATGGNIWFYSPGGMIIGSTGVIDVGSLVLTSSNLDSIDSSGSQLNFLGVAEADTAAVVEAGASITANDYVAMVAPRVVQGGTVTVDGSVAYVGAEQAQMTINNGLFDITVGVGSADANGVVHTGTTTGAASQAVVNGTDQIVDADARAIYMVAVAKNDAINMLVGGDIGYQPAAAAARTENGSIILSAGANVSAGGTNTAPSIAIDQVGAADGGSIEFTGGTFTSDVVAAASEDLVIFPEFGQAITVGSDGLGSYDLDLAAGGSITFGAGLGGLVSVDGDLTLRAGLDQALGGNIDILAEGNEVVGPLDPVFANGQVIIGGSLTLDSSARGRDDFDGVRNNGGTGIGEDAAAGSIDFSITNNASVDIGESLILDASAHGGRGEVASGNSTAGSVDFSMDSGSLTVAGTLAINANGISAGNTPSGSPAEGSDGTGGSATVNISGGTTDIGTLAINVSGEAQNGDDATIVQNNQGIAGTALVEVTGGTHTVGRLTIDASGTAGNAFDASGNDLRGSVGRGTAAVTVSGTDTALNITDDLNIDASTSGIIIDPADTVVSLIAQNTGTSGGISVGDDIIIDTSASDGGDVGVTVAGSISVLADGSSINFDALDFDAIGSPSGDPFSVSGLGRDFRGGDISITATGAGVISGRRASLSSQSTGSDISGGDGTGGTISLLADDGSIVLTQSLFASASGQGGVGFDPADPFDVGVGQGGSMVFTVRGAAGSMDFGSVSVNTDGSIFFDVETSFGGITGNGGNGVAGDVTFNLEGGTFVAGAVSVSADGTGGEGGDISSLPTGLTPGGLGLFDDKFEPFGNGLFSTQSFISAAGLSGPTAMVGAPGMGSGGRGGDGVGGTVVFNLTGGSATVASMAVTADGIGGEGAAGDFDSGTLAGNGGDAFGGTATFNAIDGSLVVTNALSVTARGNTEFSRGNGGFGNGVAGGAGGTATGGDAIFNMNGTASITAGSVVVSADAFGGEGGSGDARFDGLTGTFIPGEAGGDAGAGTGGNAVFNNTSGNISFASLTVSADGAGGRGGGSFGASTGEAANDGGLGGDGIGGAATINLNQDDATDPTYISQARGTGGQGGDGLDSGSGGNGTGGTARLNVNNVNVNLTTATIDASATGGTGGFVDGDGGDGGAGGNATGGTAVLDVNGAAGILTSNNSLTMSAGALGGQGANGSDLNSTDSGATEAGDGGRGGDALGGTVQIIARDGATATYLTDGTTNANATGGAGGSGAADFANFIDLGSGGAAGSASAGSIELLADTGATLNLRGTAVFGADAIGGEGGSGGSLTLGLEGPDGANGATTGGDISLIARGVGSVLDVDDDLQLTARATGSADTNRFGEGADATGGQLSIAIDDGASIAVGGSIELSADAVGATGLTNPGNATGGSVDIDVVDGTLTATGVNISLRGTGVDGLSDFNGRVGSAGSGAGGNIALDLGAAGTLNLQSFFSEISGFGGTGANNGADATQGAGGNGTGGSIVGRIAGTLLGLSDFTVQATGDGGDAGNAGGAGTPGGDGASGGSALGGSVDLEFTGNGPLLTGGTNLFLYSFGEGGEGGRGGQGDATIAAGVGGSGGGATGGSVRLAISGAGATATLSGPGIALDSNANAGNGGAGGSNLNGGTAGDGGTGGIASGGTTLIEAGSGSTLTLANGTSIQSSGTGGAGGEGGGIDMGLGGIAGNGGAGGAGTGGSPTLRAIGGTIQGGDLQLVSAGTGGTGGNGGDDGLSILGTQGDGGDGAGGTPLIEVLEGSPGIITFDNVDLLANGVGGAGANVGAALGGLVTINDLSTDPAGLITLGSLDVDTSGTAAAFASGFVMNGGSGATTITNDLAINSAGDIVYNFDGDGQIVVGGNVQLLTGGNVLITHTNNAAPTTSFDVTGNFSANSGGDFTSGADSIISSNELLIVAGGDVSADDLRAVPGIVITAGGSVALNDALAVGPQGISNFSGITIDAGFSVPLGVVTYDPAESATITGTVNSYRDVTIRAGGNAVFAAGSTVIADNSLLVRTGDDIIVAAGASISSATNPTDAIDAANPFGGGPNLSLLAGDITNLSTTATTPIASIIADGTINANTGAVILTGNAVDALDATIAGSSLQADINDAPANGVTQSDDNGLLSANCLEGTVCLGNISANNRIEIGQNSNNDVIALLVEQGTVNAQDILITTRADIVMGTTGIATTLNASNQFSATSTEGDVNLLNAMIGSDSILISAAGSLLGTASLTSANDIGIDVGADLNASLIDAGGQLTSVADVGGALNATYNVAGNINVGTYNQGANFQVGVLAGGNISFGAININGNRDISLTAGDTGPGDVFLGTATGARDIDLRGDNISFADLVASQFFDFLTVGAITGGTLSSGSLMTLDGGSINVGNLTPGFITNITARAGDIVTGNITTTSSTALIATGSITTGDVAANSGVSFSADGNIDVGTVTTTSAVGFIRLDADGTVEYDAINGNALVDLDGTAVSGGDIVARQQLSIDGTSIDVGNMRSTGGFVNLTSTAGDITVDSLTSDNFGVTVVSAAGNTLGDVDANGTIRIESVGDTLVGDAAAGGSLILNVDGDLNSGALVAQATSPGMTINVDGDADIESTATNGLLTINVVGALTGGDITGRSLARITAGSLDIDSAQSLDQALTATATDGDAVIAATNSRFGTTVTATGDVDVANATSGTFTTLRGDNVTLDTGDVSGNLTLDATDGDVAGTGTVTVGGNINLDATGDIGFGSLAAQGATFTADAGGALAFTSATSDGGINFNAGTINFDSITATGATNLTTTGGAANSINGGTIDTGGTGDVTLTSGGLIDVGDVTARILTADAGTDLTLGVVDAIGRNIRGVAINLDAGGTIGFTSLLSGRGVDIDSTAVNAGNITSDNGVNILADSITVGDVLVTEIGDVTLNATDGALTTGDLTSHTFGVDIRSNGVMNVGNLAVTGNSNSSDITIVAGGDTTLGDVAAGDRLVMDITGNLIAGALTSANNSPGMRIDVTGNADIASASDPDGPIALTIGGALTGGDFTTNGVLNLDAGSIDIDSATANGGIGSVNVTTATGNAAIDVIVAGNDINVDVGGNFEFVSATAADNIDLFAGASVLGGDLTATGDLDINAGNIAIGDASATNIALTSATNILFDGLTSPNAINVSALSGTIGANTGNGDIDSDGDVTLTAQVINVGNVTSGGSVGASATAGDATFGTVDAAGTANVTATGALTTGDIAVTNIGASINLSASGTNGDISAGALTAANGDILISAGRDIGLVSASTAAGTPTAGSIGLLAGNDVSVTGLLSAGEDVAIRSAGDVSLTAVQAGDDIAVQSDGSINLDSATSTGNGIDLFSLSLDGTNAGQMGSIAFAAEQAALTGSNIDLNAATTLTGTGTLVAANNVGITAADIDIETVNAGGAVTAASTGGNIVIEQVDATGLIGLDANGFIFVGHGETDDDFLADATGNFSTGPNTIITGGDIIINADIVDLVNSQAGGLIDVTGSQIDFTSITAGGTIDLETIDLGALGIPSNGNGNITGVDLTAGPGASALTALGSIDVSADTNVAGTLAMIAGSNIGFGNAVVQGGDLIADAGGAITFISADAAGTIDFVGDNGITATGATDAGGSIALESNAGNIAVQGLTATDEIEIDSAGTTTLNNAIFGSDGLDIDAGGNVDLVDATGSGGIVITSGGAIGFDDLTSTADDIFAGADSSVLGQTITADDGQIEVEGSTVNIQSVTASGSALVRSLVGDVTLGSVTSTGDDARVISAGAIDIGQLAAGNLGELTAAGNITVNTDVIIGGDAMLTSTNGAISSGPITAGGAIAIDAAGGDFAGDTLDAGTSISINSDANTLFNEASAAGTINITGVGDVDATTIVSGDAVSADIDGTFTVGTVIASTMGAGTVNIAATQGIDIDILRGNTATLDAAQGAVVVDGDITMAGLVDAAGQSVLLRSSGPLSVIADASAGDVDVQTAGDLDVQSASAVGNIGLTSTAATISLGDVTATLNGSQGGNITATSGDGILANGTVNADSALTFDTVGLLDIQGTSAGETITATSTNFDIGSTGALGRSDLTTSIDIMTSEDVTLGGAGGGGRYVIDNDEFSRIHSGGDVTITTTIDGSVTVDDLAIAVAAGTGTPTDGNIGQSGTLSLISGDNVDVIGNATMSNATADNVLAIDAFGAISIDVDTGNLRVEDAAGNVTGVIEMTAQTIFAASAAAIADLSSGNPTTADFETRLGVNDGATRDQGYIQSSSVTFNIEDDLLIQNSGAGSDFDDRRGVSADSVTINSANTDTVIVFNGVVAGNTGIDAIAVTGVPAFDPANPASFDPASTINGCLIIDPASCAPNSTPNPNPTVANPNDDPIQDLIEDQIDDDGSVDSKIENVLVDFREDPERSLDPLIDEPVTGAGNEDLWVSDEEESDCDDPEGFCPAEGELEPAE